MAYGTAAQSQTDRAIEDTYRRVLRHTEGCPPCNTAGEECAEGDRIRDRHRTALVEAGR
ncbi:hypothetical protein OG279_26360 [Streptomyces sp. NBC_01201]|uniref:hypothetical protein n=1 Tax=Streptomyces sp. NBC_01201 TaxID=2903770 RepID=UPI002E151F2B|nr:hypothetical protein OG279_26360 [Streptomyces sp. NBC_01201]